MDTISQILKAQNRPEFCGNFAKLVRKRCIRQMNRFQTKGRPRKVNMNIENNRKNLSLQ